MSNKRIPPGWVKLEIRIPKVLALALKEKAAPQGQPLSAMVRMVLFAWMGTLPAPGEKK